MNKTIIFISGQKRSGKDTIASILEKKFLVSGHNVRIIHFADKLKEILSITLGISVNKLNQLKNIGAQVCIKVDDVIEPVETFREMLQHFGTDAMQKLVDKRFWVNIVQSEIERDQTHDIFLIPDFRYQHEFFKNTYAYECYPGKVDFVTIRVVSNEKSFDAHISEHDLDEYDFNYIIENKHNASGVSGLVYSKCASIANDVENML